MDLRVDGVAVIAIGGKDDINLKVMSSDGVIDVLPLRPLPSIGSFTGPFTYKTE